MHFLEISRFEVPISRFFWTFFQNLQICMSQGKVWEIHLEATLVFKFLWSFAFDFPYICLQSFFCVALIENSYFFKIAIFTTIIGRSILIQTPERLRFWDQGDYKFVRYWVYRSRVNQRRFGGKDVIAVVSLLRESRGVGNNQM